MRTQHRSITGRASRGFTLLEALVAMLVLAFGMLAIAGFQTNLSRSSDVAKQRSEATRIAQRQMDRLRAFGQRQADGTPADGTAAGDAARTYVEDVVTPAADFQVTNALTNATFNVNTLVDIPPGDRYRWIRVLVTWSDRAGTQQRVALNSAVSDGDPGDVGMIGVGRGRSSTLLPRNRNINLPFPVVGLQGGQRSAFVPPPGNVIFVIDNTSGDVRQRCTGVVTLTEGIDLVSAGANCVNIEAYLVSGFVRFKLTTAQPLATDIDDQSDLTEGTRELDSVQPLLIDSSATGNAPAAVECFSQRRLTVRDNSAQPPELTIAEADPIQPGYSASSAPRFIAYVCVVTPIDHDSNTATPKLWSGELNLVADPSAIDSNGNNVGFVIGSNPGQRHVCRFTSDYDRNTRLSNREHPRYYRGVTGVLSNQNFLVIRRFNDCPTDVASDIAAGDFVDTNTAYHQPGTADLSFRCLDAACSGATKLIYEPTNATTSIPMN